jgi:tRNA U34 5-methylaminomethyl-2-thiouridine-forming methyltransferase MnmC
MKDLVQKIIDKLTGRLEEQHNPIVKREMLSAIEEIKEIEQFAEFSEVARTMIKHMNKIYYTPHDIVIIDNVKAVLYSGDTTEVTEDYLAD